MPESREETDYLQITDGNILGVDDNGRDGIRLIEAVNQTQIDLEGCFIFDYFKRVKKGRILFSTINRIM